MVEGWRRLFFRQESIPQSLRDSSLYTREPDKGAFKPSLCKGGWHAKRDGRIDLCKVLVDTR